MYLGRQAHALCWCVPFLSPVRVDVGCLLHFLTQGDNFDVKKLLLSRSRMHHSCYRISGCITPLYSAVTRAAYACPAVTDSNIPSLFRGSAGNSCCQISVCCARWFLQPLWQSCHACVVCGEACEISVKEFPGFNEMLLLLVLTLWYCVMLCLYSQLGNNLFPLSLLYYAK